MALKISDDLELPDSFVTDTSAILAKRRTGKSNTAVVIAEQMYRAGHQWVAIDPKGDWWGIRAEGTGPGIPIPIFGGDHGDLPLEPDAGAYMAELIIERGLTCILDVSDFDTKADQIKFLTAFGRRFYQLAKKAPLPRHLFLEEADEFLPQQVSQDMTACVGVWTRIVKLGGSAGIGATLITQRSASLNKGALTQIETLIVLRTPGPQDKKAIRDWIDTDDVKDIIASLSGLQNGEAWVISPYSLGIVSRVQFNRRTTFDSGATPVTGEPRPAPDLGSLDLDAVRTAMADTIERAQAEDPKHLRARIRELEKQLAERPDAEPILERVEFPALDDEVLERLEAATRAVQADHERLAATVGELRAAGDTLVDQLDVAGAIHAQAGQLSQPPQVPQVQLARPERPPAQRPTAGHLGKANGWSPDRKLAERKILTVLAQHGAVSKRRLALQAGYSAKGGGFGNALSKLRTAGLITTGDPIALTDAGRAEVPAALPALPAGADLIDHWISQLPKAPATILKALTDVWPQGMDKAELAEATGYDANGGGFGNALSRLRTLDLIVGERGAPLAASDDLMEP